ncbi:hypothetical protein HDV62DRAFT_4593 [Trichoderma sp. SZMC 28011]
MCYHGRLGGPQVQILCALGARHKTQVPIRKDTAQGNGGRFSHPRSCVLDPTCTGSVLYMCCTWLFRFYSFTVSLSVVQRLRLFASNFPSAAAPPFFPPAANAAWSTKATIETSMQENTFSLLPLPCLYVSSLPDGKFLVKRTSHVKPCTSTAVNKVQSHRCLLTSHTPQAPMLCSLPQHPRILTSFPGAPLVRPKWRIQPPELESYTPKTLCPAPSRYRLCFCGCIKGRFDDCRGTGTGTSFI